MVTVIVFIPKAECELVANVNLSDLHDIDLCGCLGVNGVKDSIESHPGSTEEGKRNTCFGY